MSVLNSEEFTTYKEESSTYNDQQHTPKPTRAADFQRLVARKFENSGRRKGITYRDVVKHKLADTEKQAQFKLQGYKNRGKLTPSIHRTRPQEFFASPEDAQLALEYNLLAKSSTHIEPMGVGISTPSFNGETNITTIDLEQEEISKADILTRAILNAANGAVPAAMHNIHIHLNLPSSELANEVYNYRLRHIPANAQTRQKQKQLTIRIDRFLVNCQFFPQSPTVIITIPCSNAPFLLVSPFAAAEQQEREGGNNENRITCLFNDFVNNIRGILVYELRDTTGAIIPPIHSSLWRFIQADFSWDTPISPQQYRIMCNIQLKTWNDRALLQFYRKRINGHYYARVEERNHLFSNEKSAATSFDDNIGYVIMDAVKDAQNEIRQFSGGGGSQ
jgi:hypothetical protein